MAMKTTVPTTTTASAPNRGTYSVADLRAALAASKTRSASAYSGPSNVNYPFWNLPVGGSSTVRFVHNGTGDGLAWVKQESIELKFPGIFGVSVTQNKPVSVKVPCMQTFGDKDPIIEFIKPWWKGSEDEINLARQYYRKEEFITQALVVTNGLAETGDLPAIRRLKLTKTLFGFIDDATKNPQFIEYPWDIEGGRDFIISKTQRGQFANYEKSSWSFNVRPLTDVERAAMVDLPNLADAMWKKPSQDAQDAIMEMFIDSLNGAEFNLDKYGQHYRPFGFQPGTQKATAA